MTHCVYSGDVHLLICPCVRLHKFVMNISPQIPKEKGVKIISISIIISISKLTYSYHKGKH